MFIIGYKHIFVSFIVLIMFGMCLQGYAKTNIGIISCSGSPSSCQSAVLIPERHAAASSCQAGSSDTSVMQNSDDSDSEIFRVKRRSAIKLGKRSTGDVDSNLPEHQVCFNGS